MPSTFIMKLTDALSKFPAPRSSGKPRMSIDFSADLDASELTKLVMARVFCDLQYEAHEVQITIVDSEECSP